MSLTMSFPVHLADADGKVPGLEEELEDDADDDRGISLEPPSPTEDPSSLLDPPNASPVSLRPMRGCAACTAGSDNRAQRSALAWAAVLLTLWLARRKR